MIRFPAILFTITLRRYFIFAYADLNDRLLQQLSFYDILKKADEKGQGEDYGTNYKSRTSK